jgi:hypothetical protein
MKIFRLIFVLSFFLIDNTFAQKNVIDQPTFSGTVKLVGGIPAANDSLLISYKRPYTPVGTMGEGIYVVTNSNGNFNFKLPSYTEPGIIRIHLRHGKNWTDVLGYGGFFEKTDNIEIDITKNTNGRADSASFTGIGAEKYNLLRKLNDLVEAQRPIIKKLAINHANEIEWKLNSINFMMDSLLHLKNKLINKSGMSPKLKNMTRYEYGNLLTYWRIWYDAMYSVYHKNNLKFKATIRDYFNKYDEHFSYPTTDTLVNLCPMYLTSLSRNVSYRMVINSDQQIPLESFYNALKQEYSGNIRERIIANLFLGGSGLTTDISFTNKLYDSLRFDSQKIITIPYLKEKIRTKLRTASGERLLESSFIDGSGKLITTSSLKGKVLLIDLWNVGCSFCAIFHKKFNRDVYPRLKDNENFVYLSVGMDKTINRWKEGLNSGKYTSPEYLNVHTGGQGLNHPFAKYYDIEGLPFMLLVDKNGIIYSDNIDGPEDTYTLIKAALIKSKLSK